MDKHVHILFLIAIKLKTQQKVLCPYVFQYLIKCSFKDEQQTRWARLMARLFIGMIGKNGINGGDKWDVPEMIDGIVRRT